MHLPTMFRALWSMRSRGTQLLHLHKSQLRRAPFLTRLGCVYRKLLEKPGITVLETGLKPGDRVIVRDEKGRHVTHLVIAAAYRNRYGYWVPPELYEIGMFEYEPGNSP